MWIIRTWSSIKLIKKIMLSMLISGIPMLIIIFIMYSHSSKASLINSNNLLNLSLNIHNNEINDKLIMHYNFFKSWSEKYIYGMLIEYKLLSEVEINITNLIKEYPGFALIALVEKNGNILTDSSSGYEIDKEKLIFNLRNAHTEKNVHSIDINFVDNIFVSKNSNQTFKKTFQFYSKTKDSAGEDNGFLVAYLDWSVINELFVNMIAYLKNNNFKDATGDIIDLESGIYLSQNGKNITNIKKQDSEILNKWYSKEKKMMEKKSTHRKTSYL